MNQLVAAGIKALREVRQNGKNDALKALFADGARTVHNAAAFSDLQPFSLAAASIQVTPGTARHVTIVVPEFVPGRVFAGVRTALEFGCGLAARLNLPLRIVVLWNAPTGAAMVAAQQYLETEFSQPPTRTSVASIEDLVGLHCADDDVWVVTHWTTAHPLDVACQLGVVRPEQVLYLVQDYEPGFYAWSSESAIARATYAAGFTLVVNSSPLRDYLLQQETVTVDDRFVFAPSLDLARLEETASRRRRHGVARIFFYGRPSRPRNLFPIGIAALRIASDSLPETRATYVSAGEQFPTVDLGRATLTVKGKLAWPEYFELLASTDVVLSLQLSPHPSHPPLDAIASGAFAVTNELGGTRAQLHSRLMAVEPTPRDLAAAVISAAAIAVDSEPQRFDAEFLDALGAPLERVLDTVSRAIS